MPRYALACVVAAAVALVPSTFVHAQSADSQIAGKTLDEWIKIVQTSKDASMRERAIQAIMRFGPNAVRAVPTLVNLLRFGEADSSPRVNAIIALGMIPVDDRRYAKEIVVELRRRIIGDSQEIVRFQAVRSLGMIAERANAADSPTSKDVMVELKAAIGPLSQSSIRDGGSWEIRRAAAATLGQIAGDKLNGPDTQAMAALYGRLNDPTAQVRLACARSIIQLGQPQSPQDTEALKAALVMNVKRDPYKLVSIWSRVALMRLDEKFVNEDNLAEIAKGLKENDQATQLAAAEALGMIGRSANTQLAELIVATDSDDPYVVAASIQAMGYIGDPKALDALKKLKDGHKESAIRFAAEDAIGRINGTKK